MFSVKPESTTRSVPLEGAALRDLIVTNADQEVKKVLGAPLSFHSKFIEDCKRELDRLETAAESVLERETRRDLDQLLTTLRAIARSCATDTHDVDEELLLPLIIKRLSDATDEYAHAISLPTSRITHRESLATFQKELQETHLPWALKLLDRMTLNDSLPAAERLSLSTVFFSGTKNNQT